MGEPIRVGLRHLVLAEDAEFVELSGGGVFVAMTDPPPVRAVVELQGARGRQAFEVTGVVEVPEGDPQGHPGIYGRIVDLAELTRFERVGTEALEDVVVAPVPESTTGVDDSAASPMGTPAPVVTDDEPEPNEPPSFADPLAQTEAEAESMDPGDSTSEGSTVDAAEGGETPERGRGRRRRNRNKR